MPDLSPGTHGLRWERGWGTLGYEWDSDLGQRVPAGRFLQVVPDDHQATAWEVFTDYGSTTKNPGGSNPQPHHLQGPERCPGLRGRHGAMVRGDDGYTTGQAVDKNMQQATVNLLRRHGNAAGDPHRGTDAAPGLNGY